jgi:hypothetical protein
MAPLTVSMRLRRARRQRAGVALAVLAAHALLAIGLASVVVPPRDVPGPARVSVRLLPNPPARSEPARREARMPRRPVERAAAADESRAAPTLRAADPGIAALASPASAPASSPPLAAPTGNLLETGASRRALSRAAREPNLASRVDAQVGVHSPTAVQQLPSAIQQAGKGDCLKGDYPGAGMGLLSAPFLAAALASGNCAQ